MKLTFIMHTLCINKPSIFFEAMAHASFSVSLHDIRSGSMLFAFLMEACMLVQLRSNSVRELVYCCKRLESSSVKLVNEPPVENIKLRYAHFKLVNQDLYKHPGEVEKSQ